MLLILQALLMRAHTAQLCVKRGAEAGVRSGRGLVPEPGPGALLPPRCRPSGKQGLPREARERDGRSESKFGEGRERARWAHPVSD